MHVINHLDLEQFTSAIFQAANTPINHADIVASSLVQANLAGHDSHGVIRAMQYLDYIEAGTLDPAATPVIDTSYWCCHQYECTERLRSSGGKDRHGAYDSESA